MNFFYRVLQFLQGEMETPSPWGWFHLMFLGLSAAAIAVLFLLRKRFSDRQMKTVMLVYAIIALVLEITKQVIWSFDYDADAGRAIWDYQWYAAPFQLCTTPIFACIIASFLKDCPVRRSLLSYMAFFTIIGGIMTMVMPDSCFTRTIEVNIHTMWLHCGSFVVSVYLLMSGAVKCRFRSVCSGFLTFLVFVGIAELLDIAVYKSGVLNGETFNMFYISPYFISGLPVFCTIQENVPYPLYLAIYIFAVGLGASAIFGAAMLIKKLSGIKARKSAA